MYKEFEMSVISECIVALWPIKYGVVTACKDHWSLDLVLAPKFVFTSACFSSETDF